MKILIANKYLYPRGGDCLYTIRLMRLLEDKGHQVVPFTMHHPENIKTGYEKYFVPYIDFPEELRKSGISSAIKVSARTIVNTKAAALMERLILDEKPDIVHLNNIHHQLTPSILSPIKKHGIPVVWTLHDYILTCPDHHHLRNGSACIKCADGDNYHAIVHRCKKNSFGASLLAALESSYHNPGRLFRYVDRFIGPSRFLAGFLVSHGFPEEKVATIPNFLPEIELAAGGSNHFLYLGRLSREKGVDNLIDAFSKAENGKLVVAGDGPDRASLEALAAKSSYGNIEFTGHLDTREVARVISNCLALVIPSRCWENLPYSVMEAMAAGKAVIGSRTGGIPEMIEHGRNGLLFEPGNVVELARCLADLFNDPDSARSMGRAGYEKASLEYSSQRHYEVIYGLYSQLVRDKAEFEPKLLFNI